MSGDSAAMTPPVSVLVTVFNRQQYLAECLTSILASTWKDFEVVVVDDASTDGSFEIAEEFAGRDSRVRVERNERNLGDYGNRRRAADLARGTYLKYVDSDDVLYSHSLAAMMEAMQAAGEAALGISHSQPNGEQPYPWRLTPAEAWRREFLDGGCLGSGPSGAIIRRDAFFAVGGFRNWDVLSDTDLWYRLSARWPIVLLPPGLVWWRRHPGQEFVRNEAEITYLAKGVELATLTLEDQSGPLDENERAAARSRVKQHFARKVISLAFRRGRPYVAYKLLRDARLPVSEVVAGFAPYR
jgi:glycosyltransferase involved in cell wall biosynthesis